MGRTLCSAVHFHSLSTCGAILYPPVYKPKRCGLRPTVSRGVRARTVIGGHGWCLPEPRPQCSAMVLFISTFIH
ncbi:hypothetical protein B0T17DRAFT_529454 [Bombardia bombarda]|uniref:Uncharacterized protein n=1 Tax=Bombardia bombarda TaxID=252184 RepID=A0AA39XCR7_9PEZI|nr:hypothetical protein B0T17DRAFT_529454 [Bombardia bombarda]